MPPKKQRFAHQRTPHQNYDRILRENFLKAIRAIIQKVCGIDAVEVKPINTNLTRTKEKRLDFAAQATAPQNQEHYIIHIEFQTGSEPKMHLRMFEYCEMIYHTHELPIEQFVIYLGKGEPKFTTQIQHKNLKYRYKVIDIKTIDANLFLTASTPEEILLAILCDFKGVPPDEMILQILERLHSTSSGLQNIDKYLQQLEMLSQLRNLQHQTIKNIEAMPIIYNIKEDLRYLQGIEQGIEQDRKSVV